MAQPYIGEIRMFAGNFAPVGWAFCDGQLMAIAENVALFQLVGTTYGGDGQNTFALPDLRGRVPVHQGSGTILAEAAGVEAVPLSVQQLPRHTHPMSGSTANGSQASPVNNILATSTVVTPFASETPNRQMAPTAINALGGSQPHSNLQPCLCVSFIISLFGLFPTPA